MGFKELSSLVSEFVESLLLLVEVFGVDATCEFDVVSDVGTDAVELLGVEFNVSVVVTDGCFGQGDGYVGLGAGVGVLVATEAVEVAVRVGSALGVCECHLGAAVSAVEAAFEVVGVPVAAIAGGAFGREHVLDLPEGGQVDEWFVVAFVFGAVVADDADVVRVGQIAVELAA